MIEYILMLIAIPLFCFYIHIMEKWKVNEGFIYISVSLLVVLFMLLLVKLKI